MGFLNKGEKPTRAERRAQKKAEQAAIKAAEFDVRELAKEEKRAAKASKSRWGRKRRRSEDDSAELQEPDDFGLAPPQPHFDLTPDGAHNQGPASDIGAFAPADAAPALGRDEFLLEDRVTEVPHGRRASDHQPAWADPLGAHPGEAHARVGHLAPVSPQPHPEPDDQDEEPRRRRGFGFRRLKKKAEPEPGADPQISPVHEQGTQIRPLPVSQGPAPAHAETPPPLLQQPALAQEGAQGAAQESFATLRRSVAAPDEVLILDDPIVEPKPSAPPVKKATEPLRPGAKVEAVQTGVDGFSDNWIGLWLSEDGAAIYIEEGDDGWFAVTVLPDPTTTCYAGPEYPEIQSYRMPASYSREELGEFDGERLSVITVPGLPDGHRSPMMYIYFLTSIPAAQGGGNRFATPGDPTRRVFIAADLELGTVNPWSDRDDIEWIDPSVHYYKAPGKLDAYMTRRMSRDDPLNQAL